MTRPMPGPPETMPPVHDLSRPPVGPDGQSDWDTWRRWKEQDDREWRTTQDKRLTDAECAAEFWSAMCSAQFIEWAPSEELGIEIPADGQLYQVTRPDPEPAYDIAEVWHRFATRPHALEVTA